MVYEVFLSTKLDIDGLTKGSGFIVIKPEDYNLNEIKGIKSKGYKVLAYLNIGTIKKGEAWWTNYSEYKLKKYKDELEEYYIDIKKTAWQKFVAGRAAELRKRGFSGLWLDNIDIYNEYKTKEMFTALASIFFRCRIGGYIMINGGAEWIDEAIKRGETITKYIDGYTQSEIFYKIVNNSDGIKFEKQESLVSKALKKIVLSAKEKRIQCFVIEHVENINARARIKKWCEKNKIVYCFLPTARQ